MFRELGGWRGHPVPAPGWPLGTENWSHGMRPARLAGILAHIGSWYSVAATLPGPSNYITALPIHHSRPLLLLIADPKLVLQYSNLNVHFLKCTPVNSLAFRPYQIILL